MAKKASKKASIKSSSNKTIIPTYANLNSLAIEEAHCKRQIEKYSNRLAMIESKRNLQIVRNIVAVERYQQTC